MFQNVTSIVYLVDDIVKAKQWYSKVLKANPVFDIGHMVIYRAGDIFLGLRTGPGTGAVKSNNITAFWNVEDIYTAYRYLIESGAVKCTDIEPGGFGTKRASVMDPFGNVIGLTGPAVSTDTDSVEQKPSGTAMETTFLRALAFLDKRDNIRVHDNLAEIFLSEDRKALLKKPDILKEVSGSRPGLYEYIIARTKYFDNEVELALKQNIPQIVFLGAGYDSRSYRFKDIIKDTRIFEIDIHKTQERKREILTQADIAVSEQISYVSTDFNNENLGDAVAGSGFKKDEETLFIWEGVIHYLQPETVDDILGFIKSNTAGSTLCFDYVSLSPDLYNSYGVKEFMEYFRTNYPDEMGTFGIRRDEIKNFLSERGFRLIENLNPDDMENRYLTISSSKSAGKVVGLFCIVKAMVE